MDSQERYIRRLDEMDAECRDNADAVRRERRRKKKRAAHEVAIPRTSEAAGVPTKNWEPVAERLFDCSAKLERENVALVAERDSLIHSRDNLKRIVGNVAMLVKLRKGEKLVQAVARAIRKQ